MNLFRYVSKTRRNPGTLPNRHLFFFLLMAVSGAIQLLLYFFF
jgi:uncharacterized membrane protein